MFTTLRKLLFPCFIVFASSYAHADMLGSVQTLSNILRATSLIDIIAKAKRDGLDESKVNTVPKIEVLADCGDCQITNATKYLIRASYYDTAQANQVKLSEDLATFKITKYISRNSFMRGMLGVLSGADYIEGHFEGDATNISEFSIANEVGIDEITQQLGEDLVKHQISTNIRNQKN